MQWATGYHPFTKSSCSTTKPKGGRLVTTNLWTVESSAFQTVSNGRVTVTIIGNCYATPNELETLPMLAEQEKWYELIRWPGIYSVVVRRRDATLVLGMLTGTSRIYYVTVEHGVWWATASMPLAALLGVNVDLSRVALELAVDGIEPYGGKAVYSGVTLVAPGSLLVLPAAGGPAHTVQWYEPRQHLTFEDAATKLYAALHRSIDRRAEDQSPISTDFSGGLDSGTITHLLAAKRNIQGVTYVDPWIKSDDEMYAQRLAAGLSSMEHNVVEGGDAEVKYSQLEAASHTITDLPALDTVLIGRNSAKLQTATAYGARHYFTGDGGDGVLAPGGDHLVDLYLAGNPKEALKVAERYARYRTMAPRIVRRTVRQVAKRSYADALHELAHSIQSGQYSPSVVSWCGEMGVSWWTPEARTEVAAQLLQLVDNVSGFVPLATLHGWQSIRRTALNRGYVRELACSMGMTLQLPFLDTEVVNTCFSLPSYLHVQDGVFKPLLLAAFKGELPDFLLHRTTKADFSGTVYRGIKLNQQAIREVVQSSRLAEAGLVDRQGVLNALRQATLGLKAPLAQLHGLVSTELWLANLDLRKEVWWEQTEISS